MMLETTLPEMVPNSEEPIDRIVGQPIERDRLGGELAGQGAREQRQHEEEDGGDEQPRPGRPPQPLQDESDHAAGDDQPVPGARTDELRQSREPQQDVDRARERE
jgi:hypothetical protein